MANANNGETMLHNLPREHYQRWLDRNTSFLISGYSRPQVAWQLAGDTQPSSGKAQKRRANDPVCIICEGPTEWSSSNRCFEPHLRPSGVGAYGTVLSIGQLGAIGAGVTVDRLAQRSRCTSSG